jgi:hypothetical protein
LLLPVLIWVEFTLETSVRFKQSGQFIETKFHFTESFYLLGNRCFSHFLPRPLLEARTSTSSMPITVALLLLRPSAPSGICQWRSCLPSSGDRLMTDAGPVTASPPANTGDARYLGCRVHHGLARGKLHLPSRKASGTSPIAEIIMSA